METLLRYTVNGFDFMGLMQRQGKSDASWTVDNIDAAKWPRSPCPTK
jgi:hypothetical protein